MSKYQLHLRLIVLPSKIPGKHPYLLYHEHRVTLDCHSQPLLNLSNFLQYWHQMHVYILTRSVANLVECNFSEVGELPNASIFSVPKVHPERQVKLLERLRMKRSSPWLHTTSPKCLPLSSPERSFFEDDSDDDEQQIKWRFGMRNEEC